MISCRACSNPTPLSSSCPLCQTATRRSMRIGCKHERLHDSVTIKKKLLLGNDRQNRTIVKIAIYANGPWTPRLRQTIPVYCQTAISSSNHTKSVPRKKNLK
ncbi:hypothetical protein FPV67DRAFT_1658637 [Lyophyllum atratum]|nr:hypothetical protein FPV67DRAFT_1658637 [Lyophyllum atratum]